MVIVYLIKDIEESVERRNGEEVGYNGFPSSLDYGSS